MGKIYKKFAVAGIRDRIVFICLRKRKETNETPPPFSLKKKQGYLLAHCVSIVTGRVLYVRGDGLARRRKATAAAYYLTYPRLRRVALKIRVISALRSGYIIAGLGSTCIYLSFFSLFKTAATL